jgi:hypothetical protein
LYTFSFSMLSARRIYLIISNFVINICWGKNSESHLYDIISKLLLFFRDPDVIIGTLISGTPQSMVFTEGKKLRFVHLIATTTFWHISVIGNETKENQDM